MRLTGRPVRFELTEVTRRAVDDYLRSVAERLASAHFPAVVAPISI